MLTQVVVWLNKVANGLAGIVLAPVAWIPGWLSATLIGVVTGVLMLLVFKYTSNQAAIKQTRNKIQANLLALSLFKDDLRVSLRVQGRLLAAAGRLLLLSIVPMLVMLVPMCLVLGQLALWYQARPLAVREESIVTVQLADDAGEAVWTIELNEASFTSVVTGPVRIPARNMVCWKIRPREAGQHELLFSTGSESFQKELVVGDQFLPTSLKRPAWNWADAILHPRERPFPSGSTVQSIEITYADRPSWTSGTDSWVIYWFFVSMIAAFVAKPLLKVNI